MGSTHTAVRRVVRRHRQTIDGSAFSGILLGLLLVLPFWVGLALLVRMLS
jgi:hypothetical protein